MEIAYSVNGVPIRLTDERWRHIAENHDEMAEYEQEVLDAIEKPKWVTRGSGGTLVAWRRVRPSGLSLCALQGAIRRRWLCDHGILYPQTKQGASSMAEMTTLRAADVSRFLKAVPQLIRFPASRMWIDYDEQADVLYVSFRRPQRATNSEMRDDGIVIRKRGKEIVGLTILDASKR